jgi:hypothetical protein
VAGKVWHGLARRVEARLGWHDPERGWIIIPSPFVYSFSQARRENLNGSVVGGPGGPGGPETGSYGERFRAGVQYVHFPKDALLS